MLPETCLQAFAFPLIDAVPSAYIKLLVHPSGPCPASPFLTSGQLGAAPLIPQGVQVQTVWCMETSVCPWALAQQARGPPHPHSPVPPSEPSPESPSANKG